MQQAPTPQNPKNLRRQYYIKRPFQARFILQFSGLIVLGCLLFTGALYFYSARTLTTAFVHSRLTIMSTSDFLLPALGITALIVTASVTFFAAARLLMFSHQIAGPLYRLEKSAEQVGGGRLNFRVQLRSKDQLQDLAKSMDEMVSDLRVRMQKIKHETDRLKEVAGQASKVSGSQEWAKTLSDIQNKLDEQVSYFQV